MEKYMNIAKQQYVSFDEELSKVSKNIGLIIKTKPLLDAERKAGDTVINITLDDELRQYPELREILNNHNRTCDEIRSFLKRRLEDNLSMVKVLNGTLKTFNEAIDEAMKSSEYRGKEWRDASSERDIVISFQQRLNAMKQHLEDLQKEILQ